jgi:hypothetical protein
MNNGGFGGCVWGGQAGGAEGRVGNAGALDEIVNRFGRIYLLHRTKLFREKNPFTLFAMRRLISPGFSIANVTSFSRELFNYEFVLLIACLLNNSRKFKNIACYDCLRVTARLLNIF